MKGCEATDTKRSHGIDMCETCRTKVKAEGCEVEIRVVEKGQ